MSNTALDFVVNFKEEDSLVDFKEKFLFDQAKDWLELTKDVMAFANTFGGYLVFGVKDKTYEVVGLDEITIDQLTDTNKVLQKLNSWQAPAFTGLRTKKWTVNGEVVVVMFIPASTKVTHIFFKDGKYRYPSGKEDCYVFRQGTLYVRQSAGNHLVDTNDLDAIIDRRFEEYRVSMMSKIAQVVEASFNDKVVIIPASEANDNTTRYALSSDPAAIQVKGMSFTTEPKTEEEKIAAVVAISKADPSYVPSDTFLWERYAARTASELTPEFRMKLASFSLRSGLPVLYWLQGLTDRQINEVLEDVLSRRLDIARYRYLLDIAGTAGKGNFRAFANKCKEVKSKLNSETLKFPANGTWSRIQSTFIDAERCVFKGNETDFRGHIEKSLNELVDEFTQENSRTRTAVKVSKAQSFDCYLYLTKERGR